MRGRHAQSRDWWPVVLIAGLAGAVGGVWLMLVSALAGFAVFPAGAWLTAAWIGHDITVRQAGRISS